VGARWPVNLRRLGCAPPHCRLDGDDGVSAVDLGVGVVDRGALPV
jgi:hypothetical protein